MTSSGHVPRVLVADDDGVTRAMVSAWLHAAGYEVITARDGDEALELATAETPDLLLVDVTMPGRDGYDLCRALQHVSPTPPPVIFLTAHAQTAARVTGLDAGAVDYIVKPFAEAELAARVRAALRTKAVRDGFVEQALRDGLTGLFNRREIDARADSCVRLAERHARPLSVLLADLDHFKRINDRHGHGAGDDVLRETARRIVLACRGYDIVGRFGGEEFIVVLPETDAGQGRMVGDKVRRVLAERPIESDGVAIRVTASVGVAELQPGMTPKALIACADLALYSAKDLGRNRTEVHLRDEPA